MDMKSISFYLLMFLANFFVSTVHAQSLRDKSLYDERKSQVEQQILEDRKQFEVNKKRQLSEKISISAYVVMCKAGLNTGFFYAFLDGKVYQAPAEGYEMARGTRVTYTVSNADFYLRPAYAFQKKGDAIVWNEPYSNDSKSAGRPFEFYPSSLMMFSGGRSVEKVQCELIQNPR
jgi:hypothetical protein